MEPTATDGDFQYGTVVGPVFSARQVTNALLQAVEPDLRSSFEVNFGYQFANSPYDIALTYLRFNQTFNRTTNASFNPFIQNFLGGGFLNAKAKLRVKINQADIGFGKQFLLVHHLILHPHIGFRYLSVKRNLNTQFGGFIFSPFMFSNLTGLENSNYQGGGVFANVNFDYPISPYFHFVGYLGSALLLGKLKSKLDANFVGRGVNIPYNALYDHTRLVLAINEKLGFNYHFLLSDNTALLFEIGFRAYDFINSVERINPFNGFVRNPIGTNPPAVNNSASIGSYGPYAKLDLMLEPPSMLDPAESILLDNLASNPAGFFMTITNSVAKPIPNNVDLNYAFLAFPQGGINAHAKPGYDWNGQFELGYLFNKSNTDLALDYFYFGASGTNSIAAGPGQNLFSLNSSGVATITFSQANSRVNYCLNLIKLKGGQNFAIRNTANLRLFTGIEYASIKRDLNNNYLRGAVGDVDKFSILKSTFKGLGPLFGIDLSVLFHRHFGFIVHAHTSLLVGDMKSTLDQNNQYVFNVTTHNVLRMNRMRFIVPTAGAKIGFIYKVKFSHHYQAHFEIGYQGQFYFKAINLVFPAFLTGLGQTNTNLGIIGPYLTLSIMGI